MIQIRCKNTGVTKSFQEGTSLLDIYQEFKDDIQLPYPVVSAKVNNVSQGLKYRAFQSRDVEFLDAREGSGHRVYVRSLSFLLYKATQDVFPGSKLFIEHALSRGFYCNFKPTLHSDEGRLQGKNPSRKEGRGLTNEMVKRIKKRMQEIVALDIPFRRIESTTEEAIRMFTESGSMSKVKLLQSQGALYTTYYNLDGYKDYYYGAMLTNTSQLYLFGLEKFNDGLLLRLPSSEHPSELGEMVMQDRMFGIFKEHHRWQNILQLRTVGDLNDAISKGYSSQLIQVSEALQEKKIAQIADDIARRRGTRLVLIAGPSSSGKTTTCKRLSVQLAVNSIRPVNISLDDYFIDRELTPRDESGDYDFEHLHALNLELFNEQLNALFRGEEIELPRYDFPTGRSMKSGKKLRLPDDGVLVIEGIHALNPELTSQILPEYIYRVYASALTTLLLDNHNYVPNTDNRLLRRIIRDHKYRSVSAVDTIRRWPSVRKGENRWIFPYQEHADAMFNTAMLFELAVIKGQAEPLLELVPENCVEYAEAYRLLKFLHYIKPIPEAHIPPTSLLREFLGGSSFKY